MSINVRICILTCSVLFLGCRAEEQLSEEKIPANKPPDMIQIQNLAVTNDTMTLDYRITNIFEEGIWVCYDTGVYGKQNVQDVETRIDGETVWLKLRVNCQRTPGLVNPPIIAKYIRLSPGESSSGRISIDLPIKDYYREWWANLKWHEEHKRIEHKEIMLHRIIFEIGYIRSFGPKWQALIDSYAEKMREGSIPSKPTVLGNFYFIRVNPLITEETLDNQLREVMYLMERTSIEEKEESAEVLIADVNIPCSIVVDEK